MRNAVYTGFRTDPWQVAERRYLSEGSMAVIDATEPEETPAEITKEVATAELIAS